MVVTSFLRLVTFDADFKKLLRRTQVTALSPD
jgi:hypothetical protein